MIEKEIEPRIALRVGQALMPQPLFGDLFFKAREILQEQIDDLRIEVCSGAAHEQSDSLVARHPAPVRAIFAHGVEAIHDRDDTRRHRNLFAF